VIVGTPVLSHPRRVIDHRLQLHIRHRADQVEIRLEVPHDLDELGAGGIVARPHDRDPDYGLVLQMVRHELLRWPAEHHETGTELIWCAVCPVPVCPGDLRCLSSRPRHQSAEDCRPDGMQHELKSGNDTKVPATARASPQKVLVLCPVCADLSTIGGYQLDG
jgi:hypothetical protein